MRVFGSRITIVIVHYDFHWKCMHCPWGGYFNEMILLWFFRSPSQTYWRWLIIIANRIFPRKSYHTFTTTLHSKLYTMPEPELLRRFSKQSFVDGDLYDEFTCKMGDGIKRILTHILKNQINIWIRQCWLWWIRFVG